MTSANFLGSLDPPPPRLHFTQPISTIRPQNWAILETPLPPPQCGRHMYMVPYECIGHLDLSGLVVAKVLTFDETK